MVMNPRDEREATDLTEHHGVDGSAKEEDEKARKLDYNGLAGTPKPGNHDARRYNEDSNPSSENIHDRVISKYRGRGVVLTTCILALVAGAVLLIDRSRLSNWWILLVVASAALFVFVQSKNISHSYIAEAQRIMQQEADAKIQSGNFEEPETAEWLNAVVAKLIPILNTDLLLPVMDILEDAMKNRFPQIINAVRVEEIDLGITPFRVRRMTRMDPSVPLSEGHEPQEDNSRHVNMEVEFGYDGSNRRQASDNIHMLIWVAVGIGGVSTMEIPIFAEISAASGSVRTRMELISDPPFVKDATLSFPEMPQFTLSARPLKTLNVMRLPLLSDYVHYAVSDILSGFIAPNAFTMDVSRLLLGKDVDLKTRNRGLVVIVLHSATGISNADAASKSDPFVIVTWAKLGKVLYKTRVIRNELNPQWEEVCFVLVPPDALREGEGIGLTVWDSDRFTTDDSLGTVDIDLNDLFAERGKMGTYERTLSGAIRDANNKGTLKYSAAYYEVQDLKSGSMKAPAGTTIKLKVGGTAAPLVDDANSQKRAGHYADRIRETMDAKLPPTSKQVSGILAIQIHQMADLEIKQSSMRRKGGTGTHTPSTYAQIYVNDEQLYVTRLKRMSSSPYINAKTEVFCRDWTRTRVDIVIMDYREREEDAVVGIIAMRLADLLSSSSQATAWRPILGGIGTGRCRISLLFMPVNVSLPPSLRGWGIGTVLIDKIAGQNLPSDFKGAINIRLSSGKRRLTTPIEAVDESGRVEWRFNPPLRFPVLRRYQRAMQFRLQATSHQLIPSNTLSEGVLWLANLHDDVATTSRIDLYSGSDVKRRRHNNDIGLLELDLLGTLDDSVNNEGTSNRSDHDSGTFLEARGQTSRQSESPFLDVTMRFSRGLAEGHAGLIGDVADPSLQEGLRMRQYTIKAGERKAGSARFETSDHTHKIQRQRWIEQSRQAGEPAAHKQNPADKPSRTADEIHLGLLEEEDGGGLAEESQDIANGADTHSDHDPDSKDNGEQWEDTGPEDVEAHENKAKPTWVKRQKANMKNDRMSERGVYQAKFVRTGKWLKDTSVSQYKRTKRLVKHGEGPPTGPEQEAISTL